MTEGKNNMIKQVETVVPTCEFPNCTEPATVRVYPIDNFNHQFEHRLMQVCDTHCYRIGDTEDCEYWVECPYCFTYHGV